MRFKTYFIETTSFFFLRWFVHKALRHYSSFLNSMTIDLKKKFYDNWKHNSYIIISLFSSYIIDLFIKNRQIKLWILLWYKYFHYKIYKKKIHEKFLTPSSRKNKFLVLIKKGRKKKLFDLQVTFRIACHLASITFPRSSFPLQKWRQWATVLNNRCSTCTQAQHMRF